MTKIKAEAIKTESRLEFFNRADPALQAELLSSGFFKAEDNPPDAIAPGLLIYQMHLNVEG